MAGAVWLAGCAPNLTPAQLRAWDAFQDCKSVAPGATLTKLPPQGSVVYFTAQNDETRKMMTRCLNERHGYNIR